MLYDKYYVQRVVWVNHWMTRSPYMSRIQEWEEFDLLVASLGRSGEQ